MPSAVRVVTFPRALVLAAIVVGIALALPALAPVAEVAPVRFTPDADSTVPPPSDPAALSLLQRAASVESSLSWRGSEVIAVLGSPVAVASTVIADVEHRALVGSELRVMGGTQTLGMAAYTPDSGTFMSTSPLSSPAPEVVDATGWAALLAKSFVVNTGGLDEIAGQLCQRVDIRRADGATAARVWVSQVSGLPLQRQVFDTHGELMSYSTYTKVNLVNDDDVDDVGPDMKAAQTGQDGGGAGQQVTSGQLAMLGSSGWTVPAQIGDLSLVDSQVYGGSLASVKSTGTLQLTYSDGLSTLSVSEQRGHLASKLPAGWVSEVRAQSRVQARLGTPGRLAWTASGRVFSIVSDADDTTVNMALQSLPRPAATSRYGPRMRQGLDRLGHWLTPAG